MFPWATRVLRSVLRSVLLLRVAIRLFNARAAMRGFNNYRDNPSPLHARDQHTAVAPLHHIPLTRNASQSAHHKAAQRENLGLFALASLDIQTRLHLFQRRRCINLPAPIGMTHKVRLFTIGRVGHLAHQGLQQIVQRDQPSHGAVFIEYHRRMSATFAQRGEQLEHRHHGRHILRCARHGAQRVGIMNGMSTHCTHHQIFREHNAHHLIERTLTH